MRAKMRRARSAARKRGFASRVKLALTKADGALHERPFERAELREAAFSQLHLDVGQLADS